MHQKTARLYSSGPLVPSSMELEDRWEKTINYVNSFGKLIKDNNKLNSNLRGKVISQRRNLKTMKP